MDSAESANDGDPMEITGAPLEARADCTLACDKGHITAHKLVLCLHSKYLQDILSKFPTAEHPIIVLTELNIIDIKILVNYMYTGELVITNDTSPISLLRAAQILKIDSLTADDDDQDEEHEEHQQQHQQHQHHDDIEEDQLHQDDIEEEQEEDEDDLNNDHLQNHHNNHHDYQLNLGQDVGALRDYVDEDIDEDDDLDMDLNLSLNRNQQSQIRLHHNQQQRRHNNININNNNNNNNNNNSTNNNNNHLSFSNNNTPKSLTNIQQQLSSHLDLQDLQDSKHIDSKNNKIRCHLCNIGLSDVKCLYRHVLTRHLPEKWGYKCEFCDREFSRDDHLMRHYTTKHKNMEFNREKIRETRRLNREMAKNFHDQISTA